MKKFRFDSDILSRSGLEAVPTMSRVYLTNAGYALDFTPESMEDPELYYDDVGACRVYYRQSWPDAQPLAFIGIQQGQTLVPDPSLDMVPVSDEIESLENLIQEDSTTVMIGSISMLLAAAVVLILGLIKLFRKQPQPAEDDTDFLKS